MNQTFFFFGQEACSTNQLGRTILFGVMGPWCDSNGKPEVRIYSMAQISTQSYIDDLNMAWDHTCNVVVLNPTPGTNSQVIFETKQVSEYDGAVRTRPDYTIEGSGPCADCWRKVSGVSALDYGAHNPSWPQGQELNCGDSCVLYTLEEHLVNSKPVLPRVIIGRSFRTGVFMYNITDSVQIQALSWNPWILWQKTNQFIGLGICCTEKWCHPDCQGLDGHLVFISFDPITGLHVLADVASTYDPLSGKLGVEFSPFDIANPKYAYVYSAGSVIRYLVTVNNGFVTAVSKDHETVIPIKNLHLWSTGSFI
jgi:hypothetical protein